MNFTLAKATNRVGVAASLTLAALLAWSAAAPSFAQEATDAVDTEVVEQVDLSESNKQELDRLFDRVGNVGGIIGEKIKAELEREFDELSEEEKARLNEKLIEANQKLSEKDFDSINVSLDDEEFSAWKGIVAIMAIIMIFGMPLFIVLLVLYFSYRKRRQRLETIQSFVNAGQDVPKELLDDSAVSTANPLRSGLNLVAVGSAIVLAFLFIGAEPVAALGLIPLFLGISRLIYYYTEPKPEIKE